MSLLTPDEYVALLGKNPVVSLTKEISEKQWEWRNHPLIHAWTRQNGLLSKSDHAAWQSRLSHDKSIEMFGILVNQGSGPSEEDYKQWGQTVANVGTCGLTGISLMHGTAEFSLLIGPEYQRKGYGKAALIQLLCYGFKHLRLNCIWGETLEGNPAHEMFLKLGMKDEGRARQRYYKNGSFKDSHFVSILKREAKKEPWYS